MAEPQHFQRNETILSWDGNDEIWELNSKGPAFSVPKP